MFCIPRNLSEIFLQKVKSGEINPEKMASMTSQERRDYFSSFLGETNAKQVNALFESKLLLQHQQQGIINWAKQVSGLKPEVQRDIISRVNKMEKILTPETEEAFLEDLASHKLGVTVTMEEAGNIASLAKDVVQKKDAIAKGGDRLEYGRAKIAFDDYVNGLKDKSTSKKISEYLKPENYKEGILNLAGLAKSMKASLDNSVIGRQGIKVLFTNPETWLKNSKQSFVDMVETFGGKAVMDEVRAEVISRPNAINGLYKKEGLAVGVREEAYPVHISDKVPVLGKAFKASETAFTAFQYRTRADIFDKYVEIADKTGADIKGIGRLANSLTGRGNIGGLEPISKGLNNIFFSPRFLKSNIDTLTAHALEGSKLGSFSKKQAAINTIKIIGGIAAILGVAKAINKDSVDFDPRSADFGKIKSGDTRFDVSGGMSSIVTLASRVLTRSTKSSVTGIVSPLNSDKFGSKDAVDVLVEFGENKLSPSSSVIIDILRGKDREVNDISFGGVVSDLFTPIPIENYQELKDDPNSANAIVIMLADALGVSANTYSMKADWTQSEGKQLKQFKEKVGDKKFKEANDKFNERLNDWFERAKNDKKYIDLPEDDKRRLLMNKKSELKDKIFSEYNFHYKKEKSTKLPKIK